MPQLTDRSKLPNIVDPVIKNTMDLKHLYQVGKLLVTKSTFVFFTHSVGNSIWSEIKNWLGRSLPVFVYCKILGKKIACTSFTDHGSLVRLGRNEWSLRTHLFTFWKLIWFVLRKLTIFPFVKWGSWGCNHLEISSLSMFWLGLTTYVFSPKFGLTTKRTKG